MVKRWSIKPEIEGSIPSLSFFFVTQVTTLQSILVKEENFMWWIFLGWHLLGIFVGSFFTAVYCKRKNSYLKAGTIRLDQSTDEPYLFLELSQGGMSKINTEKEIILDVEIKNYISQ